MAEEFVRCGMNVQTWGGENQERIFRRQLASGKIAMSLELIAPMVPANARPVIETLKGEMQVLVGFQLDDGETSAPGDAKKIDHRSIGRGESRDLGVNTGRIQTIVKYA